MGEREPFDDFASTHGICERCVEADSISGHDVVGRARPVRELHARLYEIATSGHAHGVNEVLERWDVLGLGPVEFLVAVMQPALYVVGRAWERCATLPAQEAKLTRFCDDVLAVLTERQRKRISAHERAPILLLSAGGNAHDIGIKMLAFALREGRRDARVLPRAPSPDGLRSLCELLHPSTLGISLALTAHLSYVTQIVDAFVALPRAPRVVVGGGALSAIGKLPPSVVRWKASESQIGAAAFFEGIERGD